MTTWSCFTFYATSSLQPTGLTKLKELSEIIQAVSIGIRFDLPNLFIQNLAYAAGAPQAIKPYAPWVQYAIQKITGKRYFCLNIPKAYIPPVCDTLHIVKDNGKGKAPVVPNENAPADAPKVKQTTIEIPQDENPSLKEICLRTQQTLERHIKVDRKEKVHLMTAVNLMHNYAHQVLLLAKEEKNCTWTLLRKDYTWE